MGDKIDHYRLLGFLHNPDGSFTRLELSPELTATTPISYYAADDSPVLAKDIPINQSNNIWIRVFLPRKIFEESSAQSTKLPLLVYFHGGGFLYQSADFKAYEDFYTTATIETPALLVSVNYRLAPENRLPAAYEDCMYLLNWIKDSRDEWISNFADTSNTSLMGSSAGANIAYQVGLRAASIAEELKPLNIKGLILHQPFFGGIKRTESELRFADDKYFPLLGADLFWDLALPVGADRDHEYCNPMAGVKPDLFDKIRALGWKILITGQKGDPLSDRQIEFFKMLQETGVETVGKFEEGGFHGIETYDPSKRSQLCQLVKELLTSRVAA